ncbi:MAG: NAD(+) diphosphatase [Ruminococcus sp.]|jgi:NAD+ diphosphatase
MKSEKDVLAMIQDITPHKFANEYRPQPPDEDSYVFYFLNKKVLIRWNKDKLTFPKFRDLEPYNDELYDSYIYLFSIDGKRYYLLDNINYPMDENYSMEHVEIFRKDRPDYLDFAGITAYQLHSWYRSRRFCGVCGKPMVHSDKERMVYCVSCRQMEYPKICPAVIVGIVNGDKILMSTYANSSKTSYALIAGFAEIGETIEDTVRREVMEEVGLKVKNIRFYKSQPWSFTDTLLMGFFVDLDGDETITLDHNELSSARWFSQEEIPVEENNLSLTNEMIIYFKKNGNVWKEETK